MLRSKKLFSRRTVITVLVISAAALAVGHLSGGRTSAGSPAIEPAIQGRNAYSYPLPQMDGSHLVAKVVQVTYPPGGSSQAHSHPCPVIGYVISGSVRSKVDGEEEHIYKPGESFYEPPNGVHRISANASDKEPAVFLAYFVCDHETPLTVPPPKTSGAK